MPIQTLIIPPWLLLRKMIISQLELGPPVVRWERVVWRNMTHTCREIMHIHYFRTIFHYFGFEIMLSRHHFQHVKISYVFISKASLFYVQTLHVGFRVLNYWYSFRQYGCNSSFSSSFGFRPRGWWFFWLARFSRLTGPGELADFLILTYNGQVKRFKYT